MNVIPDDLTAAATTLRTLGTAFAEASGRLHATLWQEFAALHALGDIGKAIGGPAMTLDTLTQNAYALADALDHMASAVAILDGPPAQGRAR